MNFYLVGYLVIYYLIIVDFDWLKYFVFEFLGLEEGKIFIIAMFVMYVCLFL